MALKSPPVKKVVKRPATPRPSGPRPVTRKFVQSRPRTRGGY